MKLRQECNSAQLLAPSHLADARGNMYVGLHEIEEMASVLHFLRADEIYIDLDPKRLTI
jgi:hypothetical protein